jgi:NAD(P)-dependent dehydrogenase (short-subunit alcohol dehydrogenase family)
MSDSYSPPNLHGKTALVTGASRGVGRGIAEVLGQAGATVFVTGRSTTKRPDRENLPGTVEETAELVTQAGGKGIPVICDHTNDKDIDHLFAQIRHEDNKIDILVNNVWGGYELHNETFEDPFWEQNLARWDGMFVAGLRAHFTASQLAAPLMIAKGSGLIINISSGDQGKFLQTTMYDTAKVAIDRLAFGMAQELRKYGIAALSLHPGWVRTERVLKAMEGASQEELASSHSPQYVGRAIAALATDPNIIEKSGKALQVGEVAKSFNFTDIDGRYIPPFRIPDYA